MKPCPNLAAFLVSSLLVSGCASQDIARIVLLPKESHATGAVVVTTDKEAVELDQPWQVARVDKNGSTSVATIKQKEVEAIFGPALEALPPKIKILRIHFLNDGTELDPNSKQVITKLFEIVSSRNFVQIEITGHTDTLGSGPDNDKLSYQRASAIRDLLVGMGLDPSTLRVAGRGERELLIETDDDVSEPSNRRVEITIR